MNEPYRILLAEDHSPTAEVLSQMLEMDGFATVLKKKTLRDAIVTLGQQSFDIVLLDLNLEDSHGLPTLAQMLQGASGLPVIVLTGHSGEEAARSVLELGAGFMTKPISMAKLEVLKVMIRGRVADARRAAEEREKHRVELDRAVVGLSANTDAVRSQADVARDQLAAITNGAGPENEDSGTLKRRRGGHAV